MKHLLENMKKAIEDAKVTGDFWSDADWNDRIGYLISYENLSILVKRIEYLESKVENV